MLMMRVFLNDSTLMNNHTINEVAATVERNNLSYLVGNATNTHPAEEYN